MIKLQPGTPGQVTPNPPGRLLLSKLNGCERRRKKPCGFVVVLNRYGLVAPGTSWYGPLTAVANCRMNGGGQFSFRMLLAMDSLKSFAATLMTAGELTTAPPALLTTTV